MGVPRVRLVGTGMTVLAALAMVVVHAMTSPVPLIAAPCCQECEASEAACYAACQGDGHELGADDSLQACNQKCDEALWDEPFGCWTTCYNCSPGGEPGRCYSGMFTHQTCSGGTCTYTHAVMIWETSSGFCAW